MTTEPRYEQIQTPEDEVFDAYCAVPASGSGPGILLFQEIFGINDNMRGLADKLAAEGYVVLVPDMFWRIERRFERKDESGMARRVRRWCSSSTSRRPPRTSHPPTRTCSQMEECTGKVGAVGFCLGGTLAFAAAARSRVDGEGIDAAVSYYGSGNNDLLGLLDSVDCPLVFHYGAEDPFIPEEKIVEVEQAVAEPPRHHRPPVRGRARVQQLGRALDVPGGRGHRSVGPHARLLRHAPRLNDQPSSSSKGAGYTTRPRSAGS